MRSNAEGPKATTRRRAGLVKWGMAHAQGQDDDDRSDAPSTGLVLARYGRSCLIETADGARSEAKLRKRARAAVCGDRVVLEATNDGAVVADVLPRRNEFPRADRQGRKQVIAANLDRVVVVIAPQPEPTRDLVNRYLVACHAVGVDAAVCLNKTDRISDDQQNDFEELAHVLSKLGYPFIRTCAKQEDGIEALETLVREGVHILVGQSGVGKSSLVDRLLPDRELVTSALSKTTGKGRHTTTRTTLYDLPGGGRIMDSPGVWEYGIWKMTPHEIAEGFPEFGEAAQHCRFANCTHCVEPGCGVRAAAEEGRIAMSRFESFQRIVRSA